MYHGLYKNIKQQQKYLMLLQQQISILE